MTVHPYGAQRCRVQGDVRHATARCLVHLNSTEAAIQISDARSSSKPDDAKHKIQAPAPEKLNTSSVHDVVLRVDLRKLLMRDASD